MLRDFPQKLGYYVALLEEHGESGPMVGTYDVHCHFYSYVHMILKPLNLES